MNLKSQLHALAALAVVAVGVGTLAGCSSKSSSTASGTPPTQETPQAAAPAGDGHGETAEAIVPAPTVGEIWAQVASEQARLSAAIENGQLKDVHHLAFGIRDLVVALATKAQAAAPATATRLSGLVEQVKSSATKLDELGDAGNLSGTQAEYENLKSILNEMRTLTSSQ